MTQPIIFLPRSDMFHADGVKVLQQAGEVIRVAGPIEKDSWRKGVCAADAVVIVWQTEIIDENVLANAPRLKIVARAGVGYENIDVKACTRHGVLVSACSSHLSTVADLAFALMMSAARRIPAAYNFVREGNWARDGVSAAMQFIGTDLHHKTLGIVGLGRIGQEVAKRSRGFDMRILYSDSVSNPKAEKELGAEFVPFDTLLRESDFVSIHCPLMEGTHHLFSAPEFRKMKEGCVLINTARGPIVDSNALYDALNNGRIAAAGLDVCEEEPVAASHPLLKLPNVIILPHVGAHTADANRRLAVDTAKDVVLALSGKTPNQALNPDVLKTSSRLHEA